MLIGSLPSHDLPAGLNPIPFLVRQPILGMQQQLLAYVVMHGGLLNTVELDKSLQTDINDLALEQPVFFSLTKELLLGHDSLSAVPEGLQRVAMLAADMDVDESVMGAVKSLREKGYTLALTQYNCAGQCAALLSTMDYIQLSMQGCSDTELQQLMSPLHTLKLTLIATNVDTLLEFERARALGFDRVWGNFYCQPDFLVARELPVATMSLLHLTVLVQEQDLDVAAMAELISQDVVLSYQLLRYINSAAFTSLRKVESIHHAIVLLGQDEIRKWAVLVSVLCANNKPEELIRCALWRASMCELLCTDSGQGNAGTAFIVGLFSLLDAMFDQHLDGLLEKLPLADEIRLALIQGQGQYAEVLACVLAYERSDWSAVTFSNLTVEQVAAIYLRAISRADQAMSGLYE